MKNFFITIGVILLIPITIFSLNFLGLTQYKFFAPKYKEAQREVFEQTQSYLEGKRQEITKYRLEYLRAESETEKAAIKMTIIQTTANLDLSLLPADLQLFIRELKNETF